MACTFCNRDKPILARGYCAACYQRWKKTGSLEYRRWGKLSVCGVGGCNAQVVSKGLCDTHRKRMERHGHLADTRPDCWGAKHKHPLFNAWAHARRQRGRVGLEATWADDFLQFAMDVGERPSPKHKLFAADEDRPLGPGNFVWKRAITERVPGESEKTYRARVQRVFRALRPEEFQGYALKHSYGLSVAELTAMRERQKDLCAICGRPEDRVIRGRKLRLAIDHCHATGAVRALLCSSCNKGLGHFEDDPERLEAAASYLRQHALTKAA